jgi:hypothetical protein
VQMPGLDGLTVTRRLREFELAHGRRRTPVVALTAHAFASDVQASTAAGCDAHLNKPYGRQQLLDLLARWATPAPADERPEPSVASAAGQLVDTEAALARLGGNAELYGRVRAHAAVFVAGWSQDYEAARRGGQPDRMRALARDLHAVATNMGATALTEAAARLEALDPALADEGAYADVQRALGPVIVALTQPT